MINNIKRMFNWATREELDEGLVWYNHQHNQIAKIADEYQYPLNVVAGVTSVLSPRVAWSRNLTATRIVLNAVNEGKDFTDFVCDGMRINRYKAYMIACTWDVDEWLRGPKVEAFYDNLCNPDTSERVTVDVWAYRIAMNAVGQAVKTVSPKVHDAIEDAYIGAGIEFGIAPLKVQAVTWLSVINLSLENGLTNNLYN